MQFSKIINQKEVKQQLVELIQHNRLSHALLFLGKEGSGTLSLALALAQYLTCEKANPKSQTTNPNASLFEEEPTTSNLKLQTTLVVSALPAQKQTSSFTRIFITVILL